MNRLKSVIDNWSKKKTVNGKSFDEIFNIDGVPLSWFYRRFFVSHVMPKPINTFEFISKKKKFSMKDKIKFSIGSQILKKGILMNEKRKIKYLKKNKKYSKKKKVLFLSYTNHISKGGKIFRIQNVVEKIRKDKKLGSLVLFLDPLSSRNYKKLLNRPNIYSYYNKEISKKAEIMSKEFFKKWKNINEETKYRMLKFDSSLLWPYLKYPFNFFMSQGFLYLVILYYELSKKIIEKENIKSIVLTANNGLFEKCALAAAKKQNIPVIIIQHGIGGFSINPDIIGNTKILVFSNFYKKRLVNFGIKKEDIIVTGPVIFDDAIKHTKKKQPNKKQINIFFATGPFVEEGRLNKKRYWMYLKNILENIEKIRNVSLIIKLHPREKQFNDYSALIKNKGYKNMIITKNQDRDEFYNNLAKCDVFLNFNSTASLEAMILNKPVVAIDIFGKGDFFAKGSGAAIEITPKDNLKKAIEQAIEKKDRMEDKRKNFIKKLCWGVDGKASERVEKIIYKLSK